MGHHDQQSSHVAVLGPAGTHSDSSLRRIEPGVQPVYCSSISEVFHQVRNGNVARGFVPIENLIQGPVTETLDELLTHRDRVYASSSALLEIRHAVGVDPELPWPRPIRQVCSHEQALRQCASTLASIFPGAQLRPFSSTVSALSSIVGEERREVAFLGPEETLRDRGLRIVEANVCDSSENKTRFLFVEKGRVQDAIARSSPSPGFVTSIVIDPGRDRKGLLFEIIQILSVQHRVNLSSIHSRPDSRGGFVFHLNLEGHPRDAELSSALQALSQYCKQATGATAELTIVGFYENHAFFSLPFDTIGIVGGLGRMGTWFTDFFRSIGFQVISSDKDSGLPLEELCQQAKVILMSVPMSQAEEVAQDVCRLVTPGQLIVENCSIKACALNFLEQNAPSGVEVLGIHTMFGESVSSVRGENVIITRTKKSGALAQAFENVLYKHGANVCDCSADEHDQMSALVQALLQLSFLAMGDVLQRSVKRTDLLNAFSTPNFRLFEQALRRILQQSPELVSDLQLRNPQSQFIRGRFLESVFRLVFSLENGNSEELPHVFTQVKDFFNKESVEGKYS